MKKRTPKTRKMPKLLRTIHREIAKAAAGKYPKAAPYPTKVGRR